MRSVLTQVRETLGEDALILETQETSRGIEVSAIAEAPAQIDVVDQAIEPHSKPKHVEAVSDEVREEIKSIRALVESHLAHSGWSEASLGSPLKASVMRNLSALGIAPDIVNSLLGRIDAEKLRGKTWAIPMKVLIEELPVIEPSALKARRLAVVGPSGAGKTTTIAKLAARHAIESSRDDLAIVSLDNHRLGSSEQIDALARLLGVAVSRPVGDRGISDLNEEIQDAALTLIDTVGLGQRDTRIPEQLARLGDDVSTLLVLPANLEHDAMQEMVDAYAACRPAGIVLTKVDEAATLGAAISVVLRTGIPLVWISDGQRVPEDLHEAATSQAWLIKHAVELMRKRRVSVSERYMAENFYREANSELVQHG
jgi:flagellar biosynthesis protein FlhF